MHPLPESLELDTLEQFHVLMSPQRLRLVELLDEPRSAKDVAEELRVPVTRLYFHLNALLDHGLIRVVEERPKGALVERVFQVAGRVMRPSEAFLERYGAEGLVEVTALAFRHAESRFVAAVRDGHVGLERDHPERRASIGLSAMHLTPERLSELVERVEALQAEFTDEEGELSVSFFQAVHIRKGQE